MNSLALANDENGTRGVADDLLGSAAEDSVGKALVAVSRDNDKVSAQFARGLGDFEMRVPLRKEVEEVMALSITC